MSQICGSGPGWLPDEDVSGVFLWPYLIVSKCSWEKKSDVTYFCRSRYDKRGDSRRRGNAASVKRATGSCWRALGKTGLSMLSMLIGKMASRESMCWCGLVVKKMKEG